MNLKESIKNLFQKVKAVSNFDETKFVKQTEIKEYIKEADLIQIINEVSDELFPSAK